MMMEYCQDLVRNDKKEEVLKLLQSSNQQAREGHDEIRQALKQLRTIENDAIPFENEIYKIIQNFKKITGMIFNVEYTNFNMERYPQYNHVILRFIQEGLTNSFRHGKATKVKLIFFLSSSHIIISIEDNGVGTDKVIEGIGLSGMKERLKKYNGELKYYSTSIGFSIIAQLPRNR
jgi:signal transduction histidine kinase